MSGGKYNVNRHNTLAVMLLDLRRHFQKCGHCKGARDTHDFDLLCPYAKRHIVNIAIRWDSNLSVRLAVRRTHDVLHFLCPNVNAHGPAYALTAEPVHVTDVQTALF